MDDYTKRLEEREREREEKELEKKLQLNLDSFRPVATLRRSASYQKKRLKLMIFLSDSKNIHSL